MKRRIGSLALLVIVFSMFTCIDPYTPRLHGYESVLVVEGLITDENVPAEVKIFRSVVSRDSIPEVVDDAYVTITDENSNVTILNNCSGGLYKTDTNIFTGEIGRVYTLHITMSDGNEYISDPSQMLPVPDIDSVYYEAEEVISDTQNEILEGIRIYVDSEETGGGNNYFRWEVEETWKFKLPSPKKYNYISESLIVEVDTVKEFCWRSNNPGMILTRAVFPEQPFIEREPLIFIPASKSDRLLIRYSALIKQYSLTKKEYDFWNNLEKVNNTGGDIFDIQPYAVASNIVNINDPEEKVLGYFMVSALKQKRIFISPEDIEEMQLVPFRYDCQQIAKSPADYPRPVYAPPLTWDGLVEMFNSSPEYVFIEPLIDPKTSELLKLVFARVECSDCEIEGTLKKPYFWTD